MSSCPVILYGMQWDLWLLYHKAIFDGLNKLIFIDPSVTDIDVRTDLYSDWKEWWLSYDNPKWLLAMRGVGGDPLPGGRTLGRTFFLVNGWRIFLDHGVSFNGNLFTEEGDSAFVLAQGVQIATSVVSTLVEEVTGATAAADLAQAVWDQAVNDISTTGSIGEALLALRDSEILADTTLAAVTDAQTMRTAIASLTDGFYDDHFLQVTDGTRFAVALIETWASDGTVVLGKPLPFTPSVGARAIVLGQRFVGGGSAG